MNKVNSIQNLSVSFLKATSEQKQFYSEFSFSFLQANPQQSQFDSEFLLKGSLDKINSIQIFLPKGTSERNRFYSAFSLLFQKEMLNKIICPEIRTVPFVFKQEILNKHMSDETF